MISLIPLVMGVMLSRTVHAETNLEFLVDEGLPPGTIIGHIDTLSRPEIPPPPYIIMANYQEVVEGDFFINENTGEIRTRVHLDRETVDRYSFVAVPLLGGNNIRITIIVQDINDNSPIFKEASINLQFSESQPRDTRRSLPVAVDADVGINTTQRYEISSGNVNNVFRLSSRRGRDGTLYLDLEINGVLDRETVEHYLLAIDAFDGGSPPKSGRLTVNVTLLDDNDNQPLFSQSRYRAAVAENATIGTVVLQVEATDADSGKNGEIVYSINRRQSDSEQVFDVDSTTGQIRLSKALDYETRTSYELVISAMDKGLQPLESSTFVYIDVININDKPPRIDVVFLHNNSNHVSEDAPVGYFVARLSVSDEESDESSKIVLLLTGGNGQFELMAESQSIFMLRVKNPLDYEGLRNYSLSVQARDSGKPPLTTETTINIYVDDVNDNAPVFTQSLYNVTSDWNVDNSTVLLRVEADDPDEGVNGLLEYFIAGEQNKFRIDSKTGMIFTSEAFDCQNDVMEITVAVRDQGLTSLTATAAVRVIFQSSEDDLPLFEQGYYNLSLTPDDVQVGNCFHQVEATVAESPLKCRQRHSEIHYAFHASWKDDHLQINSQTGRICISKDLAAGQWNGLRRQVLVEATISGKNKSTTTLVQMELPPAVLFKSQHFIADTFQVMLNNMLARGAPVVQVRLEADAPELDAGKWSFVYSITAGNDNGLFNIQPHSGLVETSNSLSSHTGTHKLIISVHDKSTKLPIEQLQVLIRVDTQMPYFISKVYKFVVPENAPIDTLLGTLQTSSQFPLVKLALQSPATMTTQFRIDDYNGLRTMRAFDREENGHYAFYVLAEVPGVSGQDVCQVLVTISKDDNGLSFSGPELNLYIPENTTTGEGIFQAIAHNRDTRHRSPLSYSLLGQSSDYFHLESATGILYLHRSLDYELSPMHEISIQAIKVGVTPPQSASLLLRIHVLDRNEHAPIFEKTLYQIFINESFPTDHHLLSVKARDGDAGASGRITYHIHDERSAHFFDINTNTGSISLRLHLNRELQENYIFTVVGADNGRPQLRAKTLVNVTVSDINDNVPVFERDQYHFSVMENTAGRTFVGKVTANDSDFGAKGKIFYFISCNGSDFTIDQNTGEIFLGAPQDRETTPSYLCLVSAKDNGDPPQKSVDISVYISVTDINDHDPFFDPEMEKVIWIPEGEPEGTEVLRVAARDLDAGDNSRIIYSLEKTDDASAFTIHPSSGTLRTQVVLDHEKINLFQLVIIATDKGSPARSARQGITVHITDVNDNRPTFATSVMTFQLLEGTPAGVEIGSVMATDADSGENGRISYSIVRGNVFGAFDLGRSSGKIFTAREVDYELSPSYMLRIRAIDSSSLKPRSNLLVVNIIVIDINDSTPKFTSDSCLFSVAENIPLGTPVWNFSANDADSGSYGQVQYEIPYQFPQQGFKIHPSTGVLSVAEKIDYERHQEYTLVVTAADRDPERANRKSASLKCQIIIQDENDHAPKFVSRNFIKITEELPMGAAITQMVALDEDVHGNGNVSYEIARGNDEGVFLLNAQNGVISLNKNPHALQRTSYVLTVVATDNGTPRLATMHILTIEMDSMNNSISVFNQTNYQVSVKEDLEIGSSVLNFSVPESVAGSVRFSVPEEFLHGKFAINEHTGQIRLISSLDRELLPKFLMNVYAMNKQNALLYDFASIEVTILDVNDNAPIFQDSCHGLSIPENSEFGPVHKFVAIDRDAGENGQVAYRIESGNKDQKFFINPQDGQLSSKPLDREERDVYTLLVVAEDHGKPSKQTVCRLNIAVLDSNDNLPLFSKNLYSIHISEESPIGTVLLQVQATDQDIGTNAEISYSLLNDTRNLLKVDEFTGLVTTTGVFDHEKLTDYRVEIMAIDHGKLRQQSNKTILEIFVDDENDNYPEFSQYYQQTKLEAGSFQSGKIVAEVQATDKDSGLNSELVYSFDKVESHFDIDSETGVVRIKRDLYGAEQGKSHRLTVVAKDKGSNQKSASGLLDVMIGDAAASVLEISFTNSQYTASLLENKRVGTEVTSVKASRTDGRDRRIRYSIVDGNNANVFEIEQSGIVRVRDNAELDYEKHKQFNLTIQAQPDGAESTRAFTRLLVNILDENDNAPQFLQSNFKTSVWEGNNKGTFVTQMTAFDEDSGRNSILTYEIVDGNYDNAFSIEPAYTGIVKTNIILDREVHEHYRLTIIAKDKGIPQRTGTCTLRINIVDVNDNEPVFPQYSPIFVSEGTSVGSVITTVTANDVDVAPETGPHLSYSIPKGSSGEKTFSINPITGAISLSAPLDRETRGRYRLIVETSDKVHQTTTNLTIIVKDENDNAPIFAQSEYHVTVPEMTPAGTDLLTVLAKDADEGINAKIKYSVKISPVNGFTIDEATGVLKTNRTVIFDLMHPLINLVISAEDQGHPKLSTIAAVQVQITGTNRNAPVFTRSVYSVHIPEDAALGTFLIQSSSFDPDEKSKAFSVTYSIENDPENVFQIDSRNGKVILLKRLDRETTASYALKIVASDLGKPTRNSSAELIVNVDDVNDCQPQFNQTEYKDFISEAAPPGTLIRQVKAIDFDSGENASVRYSIISGNDASLFRINPLSGAIEVASELDYENASEYKLLIQATDSGQKTVQSAVVAATIYLQDANDNSPIFHRKHLIESINENSPISTKIFTARAHDRDRGMFGKLKYSISSLEGSNEFAIDSSTGEVTSKVVLDYETQQQYNFVVTASDVGGSRADVQVTVNINGEDEFEPVFSRKEYRFYISPESKKDAFVGQVQATDRDAGDDGRVVYHFHRPSEIFTVNETTGALNLLMELVFEDNSTSKRTLQPELIIADSGKSGSKSDAALVFVIFGSPEQDAFISDSSKVALIAGIACGLLALGLILLGVICVYSQRRKRQKPRGGPYSNSFDVLKYSAYHGIDNNGTRTELINHYHDPNHNHILMRPSTSVASRSSGRGSAEYDDERVTFQEDQHFSHGVQKPVGYFPRIMPDSGLPDNDYSLKVPIPNSGSNSSNESIHQFNDEGGCEGNCGDFYDHSPRSRGPSSNNSGSPKRNDPNLRFEREFREEMQRNKNFEYLMWAPEYGSMAAVYAEIGELPECASSHHSPHSQFPEVRYSDGSSASPSTVFHSKTSSQTTLPSMMPRNNQHPSNYF